MSAPFMSEYGGGVTIVPSDTANQSFRALYVGGAGNVTLVSESGAVLLFTAPPVGSILPVRGQRVNATGTTATAMVGLQ